MKRTHFTRILVAAAVFAFAAQSFAQTDVANIAALRAFAPGDGSTVYRITGTVIITVAPNVLGSGQTVIQDTSGTDGQSAIVIYDGGNANLGSSIGPGTEFQNLTGTLQTYNSHLEFDPTVAATPSGTTTPPAPLVIDSSYTNLDAIESELIEIDGLSGFGPGNWGGGYTLSPAVGAIGTIYVPTNSGLNGQAIPAGTFNIIGIAYNYLGAGELEPRLASDVVTGPSTDDPNAELDKGALNYGYLNVNSTRDLVVTIDNAAGSTQNLVISSPGFNITGANAASFAIVNSPSFPITLAAGERTSMTLEYTSGGSLSAVDNADATLVSNDPNNPTMTLNGNTADLVVPDLAALRALTATSQNVLVSGTCVVTSTRGQVGGSQVYVQDSSGTDGQTAIDIYDGANYLGNSLNIGDQVKNLCGTLAPYYSMLEYTTTGPADLVGTTTPPPPLVITPSITDFETIEGELVEADSVLIDNASDTNFGTYTYDILSPSNILINRIQITANSGARGLAIPLFANYIGIAWQYSDTDMRILPRIAGDVVVPAPPLSVKTNWALYQ